MDRFFWSMLLHLTSVAWALSLFSRIVIHKIGVKGQDSKAAVFSKDKAIKPEEVAIPFLHKSPWKNKGLESNELS